MNGKQLKNSILQWAIQGKLVPQNPDDEPASALLERIRAEKARLVKEGKIKKDKNESIIFRGDDNSHYEKFLATGEVRCIDDEIPFDIPDTWEWVRMRMVAVLIGGYAFQSNDIKGTIGSRVIRISDISEKGFVNKSIVRYNGKNNLENYSIKTHDILIAMTGGTVGKSLYVEKLPENMLLNQRVAIIRNEYSYSPYLNMVIQAPHIKGYINSRKNSTNDNISMVDIANFLVPFPPITEQERIVEKYNEILPITERYEGCQNKLDLLNISLYADLRKSILQETILGKLVPQIAEEGTAEELLKRIRKEKERLVTEGKLKRKDIVESTIFRGDDNKYYEKCGKANTCIDEEIPFEIPKSWCWVRLGDIFSHCTGKALNASNKGGVAYKYITTSNVYWNRFELSNLKSMPFKDNELEKCTAIKGDLLLCEGGDIGRAAIWDYDYDIKIQNHIHKLRAYYSINTLFMYNVLFVYKHCGIIGGKGIGIQGLSSKVLHNILLPLPPLAEQQRIVSKVEQALASIMSR